MAFSFSRARATIGPLRHEIGERVIEWPARMYGIELLRLILGDFEHLHGKNAEAIFFSNLFNDVADGVLGDGVGLYDW